MNPLDSEKIKNLIHFDGEKYYWKVRPASMFSSKSSAAAWNAKHAGKETLNKSNGRKHSVVRIFGKNYASHRVIWLYHYGEWPTGEIDHINGNGFDNRLSNLRDVSHSENCKNMPIPSNNLSGVRGVHWDKGHSKWRAFIKTNGRSKYLGLFADKQQAINIRKAAERALGFHQNHGRIYAKSAS